MGEKLNIPPPSGFETFSPSELFRFFFQLGQWTEESFSLDFQTYARGKSISTVTISKWKNKDVVPTRYTSAFIKLIEGECETSVGSLWITAFETVWAYHAARSKGVSKQGHTEKQNDFSDKINRKHGEWISSTWTTTFTGETFSAADLYVPLEMAEVTERSCLIYDVDDLVRFSLSGWDEAHGFDWVSVVGPPGSGKSMTALYLAAQLATVDIFQIYLRVDRNSGVQMDASSVEHPVSDAYSLHDFLRHFRSSSYNSACLILDGLNHAKDPTTSSFLNDVSAELDICQALGKTVRIVTFGQGRIDLNDAAKQLIAKPKELRIIGLNGELKLGGLKYFEQVGHDFRPMWWDQYLSGKSLQTQFSLPDFLCTDYDEFSEFGRDPRLTHLICESVWEKEKSNPSERPLNEALNEFTSTANKNLIYRLLIRHIVRETDRMAHQSVSPFIDYAEFIPLLQKIALVDWHNGGQSKVNLLSLDQTETNATALKFLQQGSRPDTGNSELKHGKVNALYAFSSEGGDRNHWVSFNVDSFSTYLLSTLLLDKFIHLIRVFRDQGEFQIALMEWVSLCHSGWQDPRLADFCENEAKLRYDGLSDQTIDFDMALTILKVNIPQVIDLGSKPHSLTTALTQLKLSGSLLFLIWSSFNKERYERSDIAHNLNNSDSKFGASDLKRLFDTHRPFHENRFSRNFLGHSLSGTHIEASDMSQLSFNTGHIKNFVCASSTFSMTHWTHCKITTSIFKECAFNHATFSRCRLYETLYRDCLFKHTSLSDMDFSNTRFRNTGFTQCSFSKVDFSTTQFKKVIFENCIFSKVVFDTFQSRPAGGGVVFKNCTFEE